MSKILVGPFTELPADAGHPARAEGTAVITRPGFEDVTVRISLFTVDHPAGRTVGIGVYPVPDHGTVLRWDYGTAAEPRVIQWAAPHCADDECGSPCGHPSSGS